MSTSGEKISYFTFPKDKVLKRQWIHAIRREEGPEFKILSSTKVCSLHFKTTDLKKSLNGIITLKSKGVVPSKFSWTSEKSKRKSPRKIQTTESTKPATNILQPEATTSDCADDITETILENSEEDINSLKEKILSLERNLNTAQERVNDLEKENKALRAEVKRLEGQKKSSESRVFTVEHFKSKEDICYYTGFPSYETFLAVYSFLDPGENGENIRYCTASTRDRSVPDNFSYVDDSASGSSETTYSEDEPEENRRLRGRPRALKAIEEFFLVLCRLRLGFGEKHLGHLYGVSESTVSRILIPWINFMYLKFGQICIWPSREKVDECMPESFRQKYKSTRVIIDCKEVRCQIPSSLLLNNELSSSYKNHVTLKGLIGIAPSGTVTFISQLYTGNISDREIVTRSGLLSLDFTSGDSVMADNDFTIEDILPLGVSLNIPPFLGGDSQMSPDKVVETQQIASMRIHVEQAINKIKDFHVWDAVVPLSLFGVVNQMWCICAFLCNVQDPIISD